MLVEFCDRVPNLIEDKNHLKWGLLFVEVLSLGSTLQSLSASHEWNLASNNFSLSSYQACSYWTLLFKNTFLLIMRFNFVTLGSDKVGTNSFVNNNTRKKVGLFLLLPELFSWNLFWFQAHLSKLCSNTETNCH